MVLDLILIYLTNNTKPFLQVEVNLVIVYIFDRSWQQNISYCSMMVFSTIFSIFLDDFDLFLEITVWSYMLRRSTGITLALFTRARILSVHAAQEVNIGGMIDRSRQEIRSKNE